MFNAPIPGQSLTTTPGNALYERPPQIVQPDKALALHLERLSDEDRMDSVVQLLEQGLDVQTLTEGLLRSAVATGIHTIDVSMMIGPVIHEHIKSTADKLGIEYKEGRDFDREDEEVIQSRAGRSMAGSMYQSQRPEVVKEVEQEEVPAEVVEEAPTPPKGLMARR